MALSLLGSSAASSSSGWRPPRTLGRAGEHHRPHRLVGLQLVERRVEFSVHVQADRVSHLGVVEGHGGHAVFNLGEHKSHALRLGWPVTDSRLPRRASRALSYRNYRLFLSGAIVSNSGVWVQMIALAFVIEKLTDSGTWVGLAAMMQTLPAVGLGMWEEHWPTASPVGSC